MSKCSRCEGSGVILAPGAAVFLGLKKLIICPDCGGTGKREMLKVNIGSLWCRLMHPAPRHPCGSQYECPKCLRKFAVPWANPRRALRAPQIATGIQKHWRETDGKV